MALVRIEGIAPFPFFKVKEEFLRYKNAKVIWAQEEHRNMGAWKYVQERFNIVIFVFCLLTLLDI